MKHLTWKKAVSLFISFIMILALVPMASAVSPSDFSDFPMGWSNEAVTAAVENGLLQGRSHDKIVPQGKLTRAEMATIINRAFGATVEADISEYTDVSPDAWYYHEIAKAVNMETFQGDGGGIMRPDASISREEVFAVIARALVLESDDYSSLEKFNDEETLSDWAKPYASILVKKGYVNGDDLGNLNPRADITREEFAQIMHNIIKTYYTESGEYETVGIDSALIRTGGVTLKNITVEGDLILGDGVGRGNVTLENVTIKGRLLTRGGEGRVRLINTSVGESVVVKDVNGIVNFHNYRGEKPFANLFEITKATFLSTSSGGSGGGGGGSVSYVDYTVIHYAEDPKGKETVNGVTYKAVETDELQAKKGSEITVPDAITLPGYTLDTTIGYGDLVGTKIPVEKDMEIKLYYNLNRYTITVTLPDGTKQQLEYKHGEKFEDHFNVSAYPDTKFYYIPEGETDPVELKGDTPITGPIEITTKTAFVVEFHANDGTEEVYPVNAFYGDVLLDIVPSLNRTGYRLESWNTKADGTGTTVAADAVLTEGVTLYAQWAVTPYSITYNSDVAFKSDAEIPYLFDIEKAVTLPSAEDFEEYPGYHFGGWYKDADFVNKVDSIEIGTYGDLTLYARWLKDDIVYRNVAFNLNYTGAPAATTVSVENGKTVSKPADPVRKGYTFEDWYTDAACETLYDFSQAVTEDITLYAKWSINTYSITYELNGGSWTAGATYPTQYTVDSLPVTLPETVTYTGKTFGGWYKDAALTVRVTSIPTGTTGAFKVYAKWTDNVYTVTVKTPGETDKTYNFVHGQTLKEVITKEPTRIGYTFDGYNTKADGTGTAYGKDDAITANTVLYTRWTINNYTVDYELNGGAKLNASAFVDSYTVIDAFYLPVASDFEAREGYNFLGWYTSADFSGEAVTAVSAGTTGNKKFYAKWEKATYNVIFNVDGTTAEKEYEHGATIDTQMEQPTKEGYEFTGWNTKADGTGTAYAHTDAIKQDVTLYAQWKEIVTTSYTVTFYDGVVEEDSMVIGTANVSAGAAITQEKIDAALTGFTPYAYEGYKDGSYTHMIYPELWYQDAEGAWKIFDGSVVVSSDMNVYYAFKNLSLYFDLQFGDISMKQPVQFSVPYETDTRLMDSIKDAFALGRNQIDIALNVDDVYMDAIAKGASTFGDLVDANGNIKFVDVDAALADIIKAEEVDGEIREYIEMLIVENTDDAKVDSVFTHAIGSDLVDNVILGGEAYSHDKVEAYINTLSVDERIALADELHEYLSQETFYVEFIDAYASEHAEFHVTHESVDLIMAVATAVNEYTYDELKDRIYKKFGSVIDLLGDEMAEDFLRDAQDRYYAGALAVWEDLHAHEDQESYESVYPSYLTFKVNLIDHVFRPVYGKGIDTLGGKLLGNPVYHFGENPYLRQLVAELSTDIVIADLFYVVPKTEEYIGYALWPSTEGESGFLHYYDYMLEKLILFDKAMLWYEENVSAYELELFKTQILSDVAEAINKVNTMLSNYEADGSLPMGLNIADLKGYDAFNKIFDKMEDKINKVIDKYQGTVYYGKVWDANSVRTELPYAEETFNALLGLDDPTFNIDSLMDKDDVIGRFGFTDYSYDDDEAMGTVTVQAIQRTIKGSTIKARRYYQ